MSEARVPKGIPTGGQFAATEKSEPALGLAPTRPERQFAALTDYEVNHDFAVPQANDLEKVVLVADAVEADANTADAIAEALGIHPREGGYYANAAGYLGIVDREDSDAVHVYRLTPLGEAIRHADDNTRAEMVAQMVEQVPEVQIQAEEGDAGLRDAIEAAELTGHTVGRRMATIKSWMQATDDRTGLSRRIGEAATGTDTRLESAATRAKDQIAKARAARKPQPIYGAQCSSCFMTLPVTGICDDCG